MCVAAFAWYAHPRWRLVVVANRDEYHERPTAPLAAWPCGILAGKDLRSGGTWLGVTGLGVTAKRLALVTNFRAPGFPQAHLRSRGELVTALLTGAADPASVAIAPYNPFNLLVADPAGAVVLTNHPAEIRAPLAPGLHGLSNGAFPALWPKTAQLLGDLGHWLSGPAGSSEPLFAALARETPAGDLTADWDAHGADPEPRLAPVFIRNPGYGTRSSTVVLIGHDGTGRIIERRFTPAGIIAGETALAFDWPTP